MTGAYYYAWYSGEWLDKTVRKASPPALGQYDNTNDSEIVQKHMEQAKSMGIDFFSVSWEHNRDYSHVIDAARQTCFKICYFYESLTRASKKGRIIWDDMRNISADLGRINEDMQEDCWLTIDGKPAMMFYVTRCFNDKDGANEMFKMVRETLPGSFIVGDELFWRVVPMERLRMFDAVTAYNFYHPKQFHGETSEQRAESFLRNSGTMMKAHKEACLEAGVQLWGTAMPGYDDSGVRPSEKHPSLSRLNGDFLKKSMADAKETATNGTVMITSFNEWFEDTQIEV